MWVFGYGSLMWDGWEKQFGGRRFERADLQGYRRVFGKISVRNWGSRDKPCPTVGLEPSEGSICVGCGFKIPARRQNDATEYLKGREGSSFDLRNVSLRVPGVGPVEALTALLRRQGSTRLAPFAPAQLAEMIGVAAGEIGSCAEYFRNLRVGLAALGISDPIVDEVARILG